MPHELPASTPHVGLVDRVRRTVELLPVLTVREIQTRYRTSYLDIAWALITPTAMLLVYGTVLTQAFGVEGSCGPYLSTAWIGLGVWTVFSAALGQAVTSLVGSRDLVTKVYFPREAVPLAVVGSSMVDLAVAAVSTVALLIIQGIDLRLVGLTALLPVAVLVVWTAAASVFASVLAVFARDLVHFVHLFLRVGFFATPVMYDAGLVPKAFRWTIDVNPISVAIVGCRDALLCGRVPDLPLTFGHLGAGLVVLAAGVLYTRSVESRLVDLV